MSNPKPVVSSQLELPARPDLEYFNKHKKAALTAYMNALEAENEYLKAQLSNMTEDRNLWQESHDDDCPNKAKIESLLADREKMVEVLREYRHKHMQRHGCFVDVENGEIDDSRCSTCKLADALLLEGK